MSEPKAQPVYDINYWGRYSLLDSDTLSPHMHGVIWGAKYDGRLLERMHAALDNVGAKMKQVLV